MPATHLARFVLAPLCLLAAAVAISPSLHAQRDTKPPKVKDESWRKDPYTKSEPERLEALGYERFGKISWTSDYGSDRIEQAIGDVKIRWIETAHFKIGCSMTGWTSTSASPKERKRIRGELKLLNKKLSSIKTSTKKFNPWLRAHLYAHRLEEIWTLVHDTLKLDDSADSEADTPKFEEPKIGLLLFEKQSSCARFTTTFLKANGSTAGSYMMPGSGMRLFAIAQEHSDGVYRDDSRMFATVFCATVRNILASNSRFRAHPTWWREGLTHCLRRDMTTETNSFAQIADRQEWVYSRTDWESRMTGYVKNKSCQPTADLAEVWDCSKMKFIDHLTIWSRVDFLRSFGPEQFAKFSHRMNAEAGYAVSLPQQEAALEEVLGFANFDVFDEAWMKWAKREYR